MLGGKRCLVFSALFSAGNNFSSLTGQIFVLSNFHFGQTTYQFDQTYLALLISTIINVIFNVNRLKLCLNLIYHLWLIRRLYLPDDCIDFSWLYVILNAPKLALGYIHEVLTAYHNAYNASLPDFKFPMISFFSETEIPAKLAAFSAKYLSLKTLTKFDFFSTTYHLGENQGWKISPFLAVKLSFRVHLKE